MTPSSPRTRPGISVAMAGPLPSVRPWYAITACGTVANRHPAGGTPHGRDARAAARHPQRRGAGGAGVDPATGALVLDVHGPQRQQRPPEPRRAEGRRPPGLLGLDRLDLHGPLLPLPAHRRPDRPEAARLAGLPRHPVPARLDREGVAADAAAVPRPAVLPEPDQGPWPDRLLARLDGLRRDRADLRRAGQALPRRPLRGRGAARPL